MSREGFDAETGGDAEIVGASFQAGEQTGVR
jgi:hypothetical protein